MAERRGSCWSIAGQRNALFKDDLEELLGSGVGWGRASALLPAPKTHLDDVLTVRLAFH